MLSEDRNRILAQRKASSAELINRRLLKMEYGYLIGDIIGLSLGIFLRGQLALF